MRMSLGEVTPNVVAQSKTDAIIESIGKIVPLWQQQRIFNAQLAIEKARAKQSGGNLDTSTLRPPEIPVSFGIDSNTQMLIMGGIGLLALILIMKRR